MEYLIVDLQGFKVNQNKFILKEICIWKRDRIHHFIIKPPFDWKYLSKRSKQQAVWLKKNYHGLDWTDGITTFSELIEQIKPLFEKRNLIVFVKGEEKIEWLKKLFQCFKLNSIINLEHVDCEINLHDFEIKNVIFDHCNYHKLRCALQNVKMLSAWFKMNILD